MMRQIEAVHDGAAYAVCGAVLVLARVSVALALFTLALAALVPLGAIVVLWLTGAYVLALGECLALILAEEWGRLCRSVRGG